MGLNRFVATNWFKFFMAVFSYKLEFGKSQTEVEPYQPAICVQYIQCLTV